MAVTRNPQVTFPRAWCRLTAAIPDEGVLPPLTFVPTRLEWTRNSIRKADEFEIRVDFASFPLDPRSIEGAVVGIHFGDIAPGHLDFHNLVQNRAFIGKVDTWDMLLSGTGGAVTIRGRDYTSYFLDKKVPTEVNAKGKLVAYRYDLDRPLRAIVVEMFDDINGGPGDGPVAVLRDAFVKYANQPEIQARLNINVADVRGIPDNYARPKRSESLWDVLSYICDMVALYPVFREDTLTIETTETMQSDTYSMAFGVNLEQLRLTKDSKAIAKRPVYLRCFNRHAPDKTARVVEGRYPNPIDAEKFRADLVTPKAIKTKKNPNKGTNGPVDAQKERVEDRVLYLSGNYTVSHLNEMAKWIFEWRARENVKGQLKTNAMYDLGVNAALAANVPRIVEPIAATNPDVAGGVSDPRNTLTERGPAPLWHLRNGDTMVVGIERTRWANLWQMTEGQAANRLQRLGIDATSAAALAKVTHNAENQRRRDRGFFRRLFVTKATHTWTAKDGYDLNVEVASAVGAFK